MLEVKSYGLVQKNFMYKDISGLCTTKKYKEFRFLYIKLSLVLSSVKIQMISSFSSFLYTKISVVLTSVKRKRISSYFWIKISVIKSSVEIKRFFKHFYI